MTPGLGVVAALLVLFVMREPVRGLNDGHRQSKKAVRGKDGCGAYLDDIRYLMRKSVHDCVCGVDDLLPICINTVCIHTG